MTEILETRAHAGAVQVTDAKDAPPTITGYASVFSDGSPGTEFRLMETPHVIERIMPGAFDRAAKEDDVLALFNHDLNQVLGRSSAGSLSLAVDARGLAYTITPPDTQAARDALTLIRRGDVKGSSFKAKHTATMTRSGDVIYRNVTTIPLLVDVGPVTRPAYAGTSTQARDMLLEEIRSLGAEDLLTRKEMERLKESERRLRYVRDLEIRGAPPRRPSQSRST